MPVPVAGAVAKVTTMLVAPAVTVCRAQAASLAGTAQNCVGLAPTVCGMLNAVWAPVPLKLAMPPAGCPVRPAWADLIAARVDVLLAMPEA